MLKIYTKKNINEKLLELLKTENSNWKHIFYIIKLND